MARTNSKLTLPAISVIAYAAFLYSSNGSLGLSNTFATAAVQPSGVAVVTYILQVISSLLPGILIGAGGYTLYMRRESAPKLAWSVAAVLLLAAALSSPLIAMPQRQSQVNQDSSAAAIPTPHSGELRLTEGGQFVRVADPREPEGSPVKPGWQQALWDNMAHTIQSGNEQVVMVFSRQGCPWCDRLVPVIEGAIQRRAETAASGIGQGLLTAPLRVWIYDAQEFAQVMELFQIEGFPTVLFFGNPGVKPRMVPGYVDDDNFDKMLSAIAVAEPEPENGGKEKKRGLFR